ncbi:hypothetical protein SLS64_004959 [Diaporthe eres]|uniref:Uncharacterized protein n=1 Tax=Diaporthe eres TaxID=83184 RepID=A0ABR1P7H2_DIAER
MAARSCLAVTGSVQCRLDNLFYETLSGVLKGELHAVAWLLGNRAWASAVAAIAIVGGPASVTVSCLAGAHVRVGLLTSAAVMLRGEGPASAGGERRVAGGGQGSAGEVADEDRLGGCRVTRGQRTLCACRLPLFYPEF